MSAPPRLFICYAREDAARRDELLDSLAQVTQLGLLTVWVDQGLVGGTEWHDSIVRGIEGAEIAVVLASKAAMGSDFIRQEELPCLLGARQERGLRLHVVHLEPSHAARLDVQIPARLADGTAGQPLSLASIQYSHQPHASIGALDDVERGRAWSAVCDAIERDARVLRCLAELGELAREAGGARRIQLALAEVLGGADPLPSELGEVAQAALDQLLDQVVDLPRVSARIEALREALVPEPPPEGPWWKRVWADAASRRALVIAVLVTALAVPGVGFAAIAMSGWALLGPSVIGEARCEGGDGVELRVRNVSSVAATMDLSSVKLMCADGSEARHIIRGPRGGTCIRGVGDPLPAQVPAWSVAPVLARVCILPPAVGCAEGATLQLSWSGEGDRSAPQEVRCEG